MTVAERILRCKVIQQIEENPKYAEKIGIKDVSKFRGKAKKDKK